MKDFEPDPRNVDGEMMCSEKCPFYYRQGTSIPYDCNVCSDITHCLSWYVQEYGKLKERIAELESELDRTLTLSNGTVVRVGDVLVGTEQFADQKFFTYVIKVTAIGERGVLAQFVCPAWGGTAIDIPNELRPFDDRERFWVSAGRNWRPWSEVYPDRPVPGEGGPSDEEILQAWKDIPRKPEESDE